METRITELAEWYRKEAGTDKGKRLTMNLISSSEPLPIAEEEQFRTKAKELALASYYLPKPRGIFRKTCPECKYTLLGRKSWRELRVPGFGADMVEYTYYFCSCGYEYVEFKDIGGID